MLNPLPMSTPTPPTTTQRTNSATSNHVEKAKVVVQQQHSGAPIGQSIMDQARFYVLCLEGTASPLNIFCQ